MPEDGKTLADCSGDEIMVLPLIDMANHADKLFGQSVAWGDGVQAAQDSVIMRSLQAVRAGSQVHTTYGRHTCWGSIAAFGFCTDRQEPTFLLRLAVEPDDPYAAEKAAVMHAAGAIPESGYTWFELPKAFDDAELTDKMLNILRMLALSPALASRLLTGARELSREERQSLGKPAIGNAEGIDIWSKLVEDETPSIERAAIAKLLRMCRSQLRSVQNLVTTPEVEAPGELIDIAATLRKAEANALQLVLQRAKQFEIPK